VARAAVESNSAVVKQFQRNIEVAELPGREQQIKAQTSIVAALGGGWWNAPPTKTP